MCERVYVCVYVYVRVCVCVCVRERERERERERAACLSSLTLAPNTCIFRVRAAVGGSTGAGEEIGFSAGTHQVVQQDGARALPEECVLEGLGEPTDMAGVET